MGTTLLAVVGGVIGGVWGWHDPSNYFGEFSPGLSGGLGAVGGALLSAWVFRQEGAEQDLPPSMLLTCGLFGAAVVTAMMIGAGSTAIESTVGTYLGYVGGIGMIVNPSGAFIGAIFGVIVWAVDYVEWTLRSQKPSPDAFPAVFAWGLPRFLSTVFLFSCLGSGAWRSVKRK